MTQELSVRIATPGDAGGITRLVRRCYGDTYPITAAFDPVAVARAIEERREIYAVATTPAGEVVSTSALGVRSPGGLWENYRSIVDVEYRGRDLMQALSSLMIAEGRRLGARVVYGSSVTSHPYAQRTGRSLGMVPLGLLLGLYPEATIAAGIGRPSQPISVLLQGTCLEEAPEPRRLWLKGRELGWAREVLTGLGIPCEEMSSGGPSSEPLGWTVERKEFLGLCHLRFGTGLPPEPSDTALVALEAEDPRLLWVDVPAEDPRAAELVTQAREHGLGLAAYLPLGGLQGEDVLRLQSYRDAGAPLRREGVSVLEEAEALRDEVFAECVAAEAVLS